MRGLAVAGGLPCFGVLPAGVGGVVEVEQEAFASIEEAEAEEIVLKERKCGEDEDVVNESEP